MSSSVHLGGNETLGKTTVFIYLSTQIHECTHSIGTGTLADRCLYSEHRSDFNALSSPGALKPGSEKVDNMAFSQI
jgi:hypothetical protein